MADFLAGAQSNRSHTVRNLLLTAAVLVVLMAAGFAFFYHHENHADAEGEIVQVKTLPVHTRYAHVADTVGADQEEDSFYLVTVVRVRDRSYAPLFIKDIRSDLRIEDGRLTPGNRVRAQDLERLLAAVPQLRAVIASTGAKPLQPEQTIAPNTAAEGYMIFQYSFPQTVWDTRKDASVGIDFYHQDSLRIALPK